MWCDRTSSSQEQPRPQTWVAAGAGMAGSNRRHGPSRGQVGGSRRQAGRQARTQGGAVAGQEQEQSKQVRAQPHHDHDDHHQQLQQSGAAQQQQHTVIDRNQQLAAAPKQYHLATTTSRSSSSAPARRPPEKNGKPVEDPDPSCTRSATLPPLRMPHLLDDAVQVDPGEALKVELAAALLEEEAVLGERSRHAVVHYRLDARLRRIPEAVVHAAGSRGGGRCRARVPLLRRGRGAPHRGRTNGPWAATLRPAHCSSTGC